MRVLECSEMYTVGWITALPLECAAAISMLDEEHEEPLEFKRHPQDQNSYTWGHIAFHNVVIATCAAGMYGTTSATTTALSMLASLPQIKIGLLVGIGGGIPNLDHNMDIRLGDIVVSQPDGLCGGIVQYDLGKVTTDAFQHRSFHNMPPMLLLNALAKLKARHESQVPKVRQYLSDAVSKNPGLQRNGYVHQGLENDRLFRATYTHMPGAIDCNDCATEEEIPRKTRDTTDPSIYYGVIASGNSLLKDGIHRDRIAQDLGENCLCFEMEAAGLMNNFPCLVIKGISDYADSHKNDRWQRYAALTAASYAKELLEIIPPRDMERTPRAMQIMEVVKDIASRTIQEGLRNPSESERILGDQQRKLMISLLGHENNIAPQLLKSNMGLVNFNFDFSLYKVQPPSEYRSLSQFLSEKRRYAAEDGSEHVTARKLGSIFAQLLPDTPRLISAYGARATEIARSEGESFDNHQQNGIFRDFAGPDGTSLWAAATSGPAAIAVHLLACMLARQFPASEATAIWEEIIDCRKHELLQMESDEPAYAPAMAAARVEITREQMSSWDSSARSWLNVADRATETKKKQLEQLLEESAIPVSQEPKTYTSVMGAWRTAMVTANKILNGEPHSVQDGAVLLGLSSWHLYPDICALGTISEIITFNDPLIPKGGLITLGLSTCSPDAGDGIFWSLPLANLRYYGDPVPTTRVIGDGVSRLSTSEFLLVILGTILAGWGNDGDDFEDACHLIVAFNEGIDLSETGTSKKVPLNWLDYLSQAARMYLEASTQQRKYLSGLISRGKKRYSNFLADMKGHPRPMFGISDAKTLLSLASGVEEKVSILRLLASFLNASPDSILIRYKRHRTDTDTSHAINVTLGLRDETTRALRVNTTTTGNGTDAVDQGVNFRSQYGGDLFDFVARRKQRADILDRGYEWEYATALKKRYNLRKRKLEPDEDLVGHHRWTHRSTFTNRHGETFHNVSTVPSLVSDSNSFHLKYPLGASVRILSASGFPHQYECVLGDPEDAAIFKLKGAPVIGSEDITMKILLIALRSKWLDRCKLVEHLDTISAHTPQRTYLRSLRAVAAAASVYRLMPHATIPISIFSKPMKDAKWIPNGPIYSEGNRTASDEAEIYPSSLVFGTSIDPRLIPSHDDDAEKDDIMEEERDKDEHVFDRKLTSYVLSRAQAFACLAMHENPSVNLDPSILQKVMAISVGNSIYVTKRLACDPAEEPPEYEMKYIVGNIGKPGINLLIPPISPKVREENDEKWTLVNHERFDGRLDDSFQSTSLHLSFTKYRLPISVRSHGDQAIEAYFLESLVSVFERKAWVADLDILHGLHSSLLVRIPDPRICEHEVKALPSYQLSTIDSWDEYLNQPDSAAIFRAHRNWQARLAAVALNVQRGQITVLFPQNHHICWSCSRPISYISSIGRKSSPESCQKSFMFIY